MDWERNNNRQINKRGLIKLETTGLLVVDVQTKLWPFIHGQTEILKKLLQSIEVAGQLKMPIFVTEQYVKGLGPTIPEVQKALEAFDAYHPVEKFAFSCFGEPAFAKLLEGHSIDTLALIGIEAHVCVMQTAIDALDRGLDIFYLAEATGSRDLKHKEEAIHRVRNCGAKVGSVEMLAFEVMRSSKHPAFKAVQSAIV